MASDSGFIEDTLMFSQEISILKRVKRVALFTRLINAFTGSVAVSVCLLLSGYYFCLYMEYLVHDRGGLSVSFWSFSCLISLTLLIIVIALVRSVLSFNSVQHLQELERKLIDRGLVSTSDSGLLTTLYVGLGLDSHTFYSKKFNPMDHREISRRIDPVMLSLIARRAGPILHAISKMNPRPAWELSVLVIACTLWVIPTLHIQLENPIHAKVDQGITSFKGSNVRADLPKQIQRTSSSLRSASEDEASMTEINEKSVSTEGVKSSHAHRFKRTDTRKSKKVTSDGIQRYDVHRQHITKDPSQKINLSRAQQGGRVASGDAEMSVRHRYIPLSKSSKSFTQSMIDGRKEVDRSFKQNAGSTQQAYRLSRAESADFYGISSKLSLQDFPPQLRVNDRGGIYVE